VQEAAAGRLIRGWAGVLPGEVCMLGRPLPDADSDSPPAGRRVCGAAEAVLGRAVAVKLLRPEYAGNGEILAVPAEARYAARLSCHPGVVPVYYYCPVLEVLAL